MPAKTEVAAPEEQALREAALRSPGDAGAQRALGHYLLEQHRPYEAMWAFQAAQELQPGDGEARQGLARALITAGLPRRALAVLADRPPPAPDPNPKSKIQNPQSDVEDRRVAATAFRAMGDAVGMVGVLRSAGAALEASDLLALATAYEALGSDAEAEAAYRRLLDLAPARVEGELGLARLAIRHQRRREALAALTRARRLAPDDPRPLYQLGLALLAREGGVQAFQQALSLDPNYGPAHFQVGLWQRRHERPAAAAASLERAVGAGIADARLPLAEALAATGQTAAAARQRGAYFLETQQPRRAVQEFERLVTLEPDRPDVFLHLSSAYDKLDERGKAAEVAAHGLERHPDDTRLLARRAQLLLMTDDRAAGAQLCRRWLERDPDAAEPYRLLGTIERVSHRPGDAFRLSEQAIARDPRNVEYYQEAARALVADPTPAHLRRAAELLRRAAALDPPSGEAFLQLGEALERLGDREGALRQYLRSMDRTPMDRRGAVALTQLSPRLGKSSRTSFYGQIARGLHERETAARALWRRVFRNPADADAHAQLVPLLLQAGELQQARYQLEQVIKLQPTRKAERLQLRILEHLLAPEMKE